MKRKTKSKPFYEKLKVLNAKGVFKPETPKLMMKLNVVLKNCLIYLQKLAKVASVHHRWAQVR